MTAQKHTPGPWMVMDGTYGFGTELGVCEVETEYFVAGIVADIPELEDRARANANLIAAAPDMMEALCEAEEYFDNRADADHDETGFVPNEEMKLLTVVRAAIAKATGQ